LKVNDFATYITNWYQTHKRDLPWRSTQDPYQIWLSEIILQQTRVQQGLPYYHKFLDAYPNVFALAEAEEREVLRLWQGLGYYSRARNLHACARQIVEDFQGHFPQSYSALIKLKGVGQYTAAAIASFAFNETVAVLDGNVFRVLSRVFGIKEDIASSSGQKKFFLLAQDLVPQGKANEYNQAIMEFGALQCTPQKPACLLCPLSHFCYAYQHSEQHLLPIKIKKIKIRKRFFSYVVIRDQQGIYMKMRKEQDIWKGLYDFYLIETTENVNLLDEVDDQFLRELLSVSPTVEVSSFYKHQLTHQQLYVRFYIVSLNESKLANSLLKSHSLKCFTVEEIKKLPKPILIDNYLSEVIF